MVSFLNSVFAKQVNGDIESISIDTPVREPVRPGLYYAPKSPGWKIIDIDWRFVFAVQHYGTIFWYTTTLAQLLPSSEAFYCFNTTPATNALTAYSLGSITGV